jgi:CAP-Gly domain-containing linker protein 1
MVYEKKLGDAQHKQYQQDTIIRELEDKIAEALMKQNAPPLTPSQVAREAETAAEIENENLKAQVEHQQKKITGLEDQIDEMQVQLEKEAEVALKNNEKYLTNERKYKDDMSQQRQDMAGLREQISKGKDRIADLEHALKDQAKTLAGAQAEIESNRLDLAVRILVGVTLRDYSR